MPLSDGLDTRRCKILDPRLKQEISIDRCGSAVSSSRAAMWPNAGSAMLSADVGSWTQTCYSFTMMSCPRTWSICHSNKIMSRLSVCVCASVRACVRVCLTNECVKDWWDSDCESVSCCPRLVINRLATRLIASRAFEIPSSAAYFNAVAAVQVKAKNATLLWMVGGVFESPEALSPSLHG